MIHPNKKTVPFHPQVILFLMEHKKRYVLKKVYAALFQ